MYCYICLLLFILMMPANPNKMFDWAKNNNFQNVQVFRMFQVFNECLQMLDTFKSLKRNWILRQEMVRQRMIRSLQLLSVFVSNFLQIFFNFKSSSVLWSADRAVSHGNECFQVHVTLMSLQDNILQTRVLQHH